eukprot:278167-Pelagomonas_calceolata.AAC.1
MRGELLDTVADNAREAALLDSCLLKAARDTAPLDSRLVKHARGAALLDSCLVEDARKAALQDACLVNMSDMPTPKRQLFSHPLASSTKTLASWVSPSNVSVFLFHANVNLYLDRHHLRDGQNGYSASMALMAIHLPKPCVALPEEMLP